MKLKRLLRGPFIWITVLLLVSFTLLAQLSSAGEPEELRYDEFVAQLEAGEIATVEDLVRDKQLTGTLADPDETEYVVSYNPDLNGEELSAKLSAAREQGLITEQSANPQPGNVFVQVLLSILPFVIIFGLFIFLMMNMQGGGNRVMSFGKSKAKLVSKDAPKVTFSDVAGSDEAVEELYEIKDFLENPAKFQSMGAKIPKGVLLFGPPGTGKTLLARAVAGEAGVPFFSISGSDFVEMFVGVGASRVRDLFEQAKANAPAIIFMDEIDAVGRHRGAGMGGGHDEREQTLNQLLVEMDGFEANEGVILLAATNRVDVLDPALLRPGRFDRQVVVDAPDVKGREMILRVHARKLPLAGDVDLQVIAKGTPGLSGADLANICNEAALLAARRDAETVCMADFEGAKDKIMLGTERRSMVLTENERKLTAYHEAGHAVIGLRVPGLDPIHKVTIVPRGRALGITASLPEEDRHSYTKDWLEGQLCMLYGGRVAEEMVFGPEKVTTGAGNDIERATQMARRMVTRFGMSDAVGLMAIGDSDHQVFLGREMTQKRDISEHTAQLVDQEVKRILDEAHERAREVLEREQDLLEVIARGLLERETLNRDEIDLLSDGKPLPEIEREPPLESAETGAGPDSSRPEDGDDGKKADREPAEGEDEGPGSGVGAADEDSTPEVEEDESASLPSPTARRARRDPDPDASRG